MTKFSLLVLGFSVLALTGCVTGMKKEIEDNGRYWQRVDTTDSVYQRGPKAEQMLVTDMSRCTAELNELQRLTPLRNAVPPATFDANGQKIEPNSPQARMGHWDAPERDGYLLTEHMDYHDFEGCMKFKGWERVKFMNYETVDRARDTYLDSIGYERYQSSLNTKAHTDYDHLNK